jgi:hypothetical protein
VAISLCFLPPRQNQEPYIDGMENSSSRLYMLLYGLPVVGGGGINGLLGKYQLTTGCLCLHPEQQRFKTKSFGSENSLTYTSMLGRVNSSRYLTHRSRVNMSSMCLGILFFKKDGGALLNSILLPGERVMSVQC